MKQSKKIALGSMLSALGVITLLAGSFIEVLDLTAIVFSMIFIIIAVIELGGAFPWVIYAVTGTLALLLCPLKIVALEYILFGGIYPIFKEIFERKHYIIAWTLKLSLFNTGLLLIILLSEYILHLPDTGFAFRVPIILFGNLFFIIVDLALTRIITFYIMVIRKKLKLKNLF